MISDGKDLSLDFRITQDMVNAFARLTGDYNSMHMDDEIARRSRFRRPIVHGMLPLSFISSVQRAFPNESISFRSISVHFSKPVFVGDTLTLAVRLTGGSGDTCKFRADWKRKKSGEVLIVAKGHVSERRNVLQTAGRPPEINRFLMEDVSENQYVIDDLQDQSEELEFVIAAELVKAYNDTVLGQVSNEVDNPCTNLLATLLLSTMVGMRLPGRYATFSRFSLEFDEDLQLNCAYSLKAHLTKVSRQAEHITAQVSIEDENHDPKASGEYEVVVNAPPKTMLSCRQIKKANLTLGLSGKTALIVGASRGIGETTAKLLSMLGAKTALTYFRGQADANLIVQDIVQEGGNAIALKCDVTSDNDVHDLIEAVVGHYGSIDILVNNAVKEFSPGDVQDLVWDDYLEELEVSVKGLHACCKSVIPVFKKQGHGKIINLSTVAVANPVSGQSRYITAKSAVEGYTKSLAVELAKYGIQVNLVVPNMTETDLVSGIPQTFRERLAESRAYGRHVKPIEVAQCVAYLSSDWSDAMSGQKIVLNLGEVPFA